MATTLLNLLTNISRRINTNKFNREHMVTAINASLANQLVVSENVATAVTASTFEYTLPAGVSDVIAVDVGNSTDGWQENNYWVEENGKLRFYGSKEPSSTSDSLRLKYRTRPAAVSLDADTISDQIDPQLVELEALYHLHAMRDEATRGQEPYEKELAQQFLALAMQRRGARPKPGPSPRYAGW